MFVFLIGILIGLWAGQQFSFIPNVQEQIGGWFERPAQVQQEQTTEEPQGTPFKGAIETSATLEVPTV